MLAVIEITLIWHEQTTKRHYRDNIEYRDVLTHDNRHQLFLISPIPSHEVDCSVAPWSMVEIISALTLLTCGFQEHPLVPLYTHQTSQVCNCMLRVLTHKITARNRRWDERAWAQGYVLVLKGTILPMCVTVCPYSIPH